jgi:hypothetical protein
MTSEDPPMPGAVPNSIPCVSTTASQKVHEDTTQSPIAITLQYLFGESATPCGSRRNASTRSSCTCSSPSLGKHSSERASRKRYYYQSPFLRPTLNNGTDRPNYRCLMHTIMRLILWHGTDYFRSIMSVEGRGSFIPAPQSHEAQAHYFHRLLPRRLEAKEDSVLILKTSQLGGTAVNEGFNFSLLPATVK